MARAGNVYRHDYEDVVAQFVWDTVQQALPPLRAVIEGEIVRSDDGRYCCLQICRNYRLQDANPAFRCVRAFAKPAALPFRIPMRPS